ncbi:MAG TPA: hypothetical protein PL105_20410 [Caldilineaceae bacterium]|nr:hypothetical protein [Caldilineaceae bacterium]
MQAIRQIMQVVDRRVTIELPADFAGQQVEVIVQATQPPVNRGDSALDPALRSFLELDTSAYTPAQREAYARASKPLRRGRRPDEPRILGIFAGLVEVADDFDAPLPDEDLWWGADCPGNCGRLHPGVCR